MEKLILHNINKSYERGVPVLKDISLSVAKGDFVVLLGPSGSGKSTILSIIAGLEQQTSGDVIIVLSFMCLHFGISADTDKEERNHYERQ